MGKAMEVGRCLLVALLGGVVPIGTFLLLIIMGMLHRGSCPLQPCIPAWLVGSGLTGMISYSLAVYSYYGLNEPFSQCHPIYYILTKVSRCLYELFRVVWVILGNVWVFTTRSQMLTQNLPDLLCQPEILEYALVWVVITDAIVVVAGVAVMCVGLHGLCDREDSLFTSRRPYVINE